MGALCQSRLKIRTSTFYLCDVDLCHPSSGLFSWSEPYSSAVPKKKGRALVNREVAFPASRNERNGVGVGLREVMSSHSGWRHVTGSHGSHVGSMIRTAFRTMSRFSFLFFLVCSGASSAFLPPLHGGLQKRQVSSQTEWGMVKPNKGNNDDRSIEEVEREASQKVASSLLFPWRLQEVVTKTAWTFVLIGFLLNLFGYDYVFDKQNYSLRIDTIENKQFQQELVRHPKPKASTRRENVQCHYS